MFSGVLGVLLKQSLFMKWFMWKYLVAFTCLKSMKRGFEQENLYTLSKHATEFKNKVNDTQILIHSEMTLWDDLMRWCAFRIHPGPTSHLSVKLSLIFVFQGKSLDWEWWRKSCVLSISKGLSGVSTGNSTVSVNFTHWF